MKWRVALLALPMAAIPSVWAEISVSHAEAMSIGRKIWQNECGGTIAGLTSWNAGEDFASLGIGHFIWYPAGRRGPFEESFPAFLHFAEQHGAKLPEEVMARGDAPCPWNSRAEFLAAQSSARMKIVRKFLAGTIDLQAQFLVERLRNALPRMLDSAPSGERDRVRQNFQVVASTARGCYALVDYVNFKGEGVLATERYQGFGWGLLQVLEGMPATPDGEAGRKKFADSAARVLRERVENSPPERHEQRWLPGWLSRVATYR